MDIFYDYEREFTSAAKDVTSILSRIPSMPPQQKRTAEKDVNRLLRDMEDMLGKMEDAARESGQRGMLESSLKRKGQDLQRLRRELGKKLQEEAAESVEEEYARRGAGQREQILEGVARVDKSTERLQNTYAISQENEEIAAETLGTLYQQRSQLESASQKVDEINDNMGNAGSTLRDIANRAMKDKIILGVANTLLFIFICLLIYFIIA
jgi:vesicle transport through interaction with t-SNAREs protein 1